MEIKSEMEKNIIRMQSLTEMVDKNIKVAQEKQKLEYEKRLLKKTKGLQETIDVGAAYKPRFKGHAFKGAVFKPRFKGPFNVSYITKGKNFKLTDLNGTSLPGAHKRIHIKKFIENDLTKDNAVSIESEDLNIQC
nr:uncharacterized protein LOC124815432 [Hydra vulgaris]